MKKFLRTLLIVFLIIIMFVQFIPTNVFADQNGDAVWYNKKTGEFDNVTKTNGETDWMPVNSKEALETINKDNKKITLLSDKDTGEFYNLPVTVQAKDGGGYKAFYVYNNTLKEVDLKKIKGTDKWSFVGDADANNFMITDSSGRAYVPLIEDKNGKPSITGWIQPKDESKDAYEKAVKNITSTSDLDKISGNFSSALQTNMDNTKSTSEATTTEVIKDVQQNQENMQQKSDDNKKDDEDDDPISKMVDGVAGLILYPAKVLPLVIGKVCEWILGLFSTSNDHTLTIDDILFNKLPITGINFFDFSSSDETANKIRENVAVWYYSVRNIAAVALIAVAVYVGIRMAIATVAAERAKYSQMLVDWLTSLALLFVLHLAMALIINANNAIVQAMNPKEVGMKEITDQFFEDAWSVGFTKGIGCAIAYVMLVGMTFVFLLSYLKRMITIAFLIIIAPLVTITYSLDKMGDSKSQALNTWFREFLYNVIIQPFQCITYLALGETSLSLLSENVGIKSAVIAIMMLLFIYQAEKIVRHIFHMEPRSMSETVGNAVFLSTALGMVGKGGSKSSGGGSSSDDDTKSSNKAVAAKYANPVKTKSAGAVAGERPETKLNKAERFGLSARARFDSSKLGQSKPVRGASKLVGDAVNRVKNPKSNAGRKIKGFASKVPGSKIFRGYVGMNARLAGDIMGIGFGGATGDSKNMIGGIRIFRGIGSNVSDSYNRRAEKSNLNSALNRYAEENGIDMSTEEGRQQAQQHAIDLMKGDYSGDFSDSDWELKKAMDDLNSRYSAEGKDSNGVVAAIDKDFNNMAESKANKEAKKEAKHRYYTAKMSDQKKKQNFDGKDNGENNENQTSNKSQPIHQSGQARKASAEADNASTQDASKAAEETDNFYDDNVFGQYYDDNYDDNFKGV